MMDYENDLKKSIEAINRVLKTYKTTSIDFSNRDASRYAKSLRNEVETICRAMLISLKEFESSNKEFEKWNERFDRF